MLLDVKRRPKTGEMVCTWVLIYVSERSVDIKGRLAHAKAVHVLRITICYRYLPKQYAVHRELGHLVNCTQ
jgi:hypothetical protein